MPLKLVPPRAGRSPYWSVRGTHLTHYVNRSTKLTEKSKANALRKRWQEDIERDRLAKPGEQTFLGAIVGYLKAGGDNRFLGSVDPATGIWTGIAGKLGGLPLSSIDQATIDETAVALLPNATQATRNRQVYTPISAVLKHAGIETKLRRPAGWRGHRRTQWMTPTQAFAFLSAADDVSGDFAAFLTVLLYTGLRLSEALKLTCDRVNLSEGYAFIPATKNGDPRTVYLPPAAVAALAGLSDGVDRGGAKVFHLTKSGRLYEILGRVKTATDMKWVSFHLFRHTWATWMRRYGGLDTTGLVATGAWRDRASAARYEHTDVTEEARKAVLLPVAARRA